MLTYVYETLMINFFGNILVQKVLILNADKHCKGFPEPPFYCDIKKML